MWRDDNGITMCAAKPYGMSRLTGAKRYERKRCDLELHHAGRSKPFTRQVVLNSPSAGKQIEVTHGDAVTFLFCNSAERDAYSEVWFWERSFRTFHRSCIRKWSTDDAVNAAPVDVGLTAMWVGITPTLLR